MLYLSETMLVTCINSSKPNNNSEESTIFNCLTEGETKARTYRNCRDCHESPFTYPLCCTNFWNFSNEDMRTGVIYVTMM